MSQEFLLKTDVPVKTVQQSTVAVTPTKGDELESQATPAFSSELDKQIDKQTSPEAAVETAGPTPEGTAQATGTESDVKPEVLTDKNGNPLPTNEQITEQLVAQWLDDFEGTPEQKQQLTELIAQFVDEITNDADPELDIEQRVATFVSQLEEIKTALSNSNNKAALDTEQTAPEVLAKTVITPVVTADSEPNKPVIADIKPVNTDKEAVLKTALSVTEQKQATKETTPLPGQTASKTNTVNDDATKIASAITEQQDKTSSQTSTTKADKVTVVEELVKQLFPEKATATTAKTQELTQAQSEAAKANPSVALRPDILNALTGSEKSTPKTDKVVTIANLQTDLTLNNEKKAQRIVQLVELLKPAKADDKTATSWDKSLLNQTTTTVSTQTTTATNTPKAAPPVLDIQPALNSKAWDRVVSSRVIWMATEGVQQAALKLNPAQLGPVEVRVNVHNEQVNVSFVAQNAATRDALEQALPRLRESFSENGLELADAGVSDQASQQMKDEEESEQTNSNSHQDGTVTAANTNDPKEQAIVGVQQSIELGVNVYA